MLRRMRLTDIIALAAETRWLSPDPAAAREQVLSVFAAHSDDPTAAATLLAPYAPRPDRSVTLLSLHVHDSVLLMAVPDEVMTANQRATVEAARGGWFDYFLSCDGSVDAYAGALRLCAWAGLAGDHNWANNYDEAVEYFTEEGQDGSRLATPHELSRDADIWSQYVALSEWCRERVDLLAERPSDYVWLCWRA